MQVRATRRRVLGCVCAGMATGLAGCSSDDADDGSGDDTAPSVATGGGDDAGVTLAHTPQTGRYEFEGWGVTGVETFVWDVLDTDGTSGTVEIAVDFGRYGTDTYTIETTPIYPESRADGRPIGDGHDVDDVTDAEFGELWFPILAFGETNLRALSVGDSWPHAGKTFEVTGTDTHAGLDCLVVEEKIVERVERRFCVAADHGMVVDAERTTSSGDPEVRVTLTSYDG